MVKTIIALYRDTATAQKVVEALLEAGFSGDDLSVLVKDRRHPAASPHDEARPAEGASFGALVGALVGLGSALMPGIGPLIGGGPLAVVLTAGIGAAVGALTGGITASALDLGLSEAAAAAASASAAAADEYAGDPRWGGTVVSLTTKAQWLEWAQNIMRRHDPLKIEEREARWYDSDWPTHISSHFMLPSSDEQERRGKPEFDSGTLLHRRARIYKYNN